MKYLLPRKPLQYIRHQAGKIEMLVQIPLQHCCGTSKYPIKILCEFRVSCYSVLKCAHEKKLSPWALGDHGGHGSRPNDHGWERSQLSHGKVTAQSRLGHSSVTAQSQLNHGIFSMITARSQLNHGPGHGSVTAGCDHFGHHELTVSSRWAVTVANFFSWVDIS